MAAHVLQLRLAQDVAPFRRGWRASVRAGAVVVLVLACAAAIVWALLLLRDAPATTARVVSIVVGSFATAGFLVAPFWSSASDPLDPRAFSLLPLSPTGLAGSAFLAAVASLPVAALIAVDIALVLVGIAQGVHPTAVVSGALMHLATCILAARLGYAAAARLRAARRSREGGVLLTVVALAVVAPGAVYALSQSWEAGPPPLAVSAADALALTPLGAAAAVVTQGAGAPMAIGIATCVLFAAAWWVCVWRAFRTVPLPPSHHTRRLGWFAMLPGTAAGAIGARGILYWATDVRYLANAAVVPIAGVLPMAPLLIAGVPLETAALLPLPIMAAFLGWIAHNDLAYDSEAVWLHIVSGVRGVSDRTGRLVPVVLLAVPILSTSIALSAAVADLWESIPALTGVALALFLSGLGMSSIASALAPYAVARPGDSPFRQPQRLGARGAIAPAVALVVTLGVAAPTLIRAYDVLVLGRPDTESVFFWGAATGAGVLIAGVLIGAIVFERRGHRIMDLAVRAG
ncbi:hypothetical protein [Microbacterium sp. G2-8]|uniref:hypothetical protein n=1 Tax=Microbacterium sp. G2-8 TaxID=2842454 RepID=UPI001C8ADC5A|nr:hypothetical protein [Microbacterium sp. G2-8]